MNTVLILGATSDIAQSLAKILAQNNYNLILAGRSLKKLETIQKDLSIRFNNSVCIKEFNALKFESHHSFFEELKEKPDITICVFGFLGDQEKAQFNWNECKRILETNYTGAVSILNIFANYYEQKKEGIIVGISSVAGERGRKSNYYYGSSKAGLTAYLSGLRNRLHSYGVRVITVKPGYVNTSMTEKMDIPKLLTAQPETVANAVFKGMRKGKDVIYVLSVWRLIMLIIRNIPEKIFKKLNL